MSDDANPLAETVHSNPGIAATDDSLDGDFLAPGTTFGRYAIVRRIGMGGMGAVYEAQHVDLKKRVALKTLHREVARNADARARFLREGQAASRIRHPHVVDVSDVGVQDGLPYMVMEFFEGEDLAAKAVRDGPLGVEATVDIMLPVLAAIGAAHDEGIVHRDLKPENIFLARNRQGEEIPKVLDFGISKLSDEGGAITGTGALLGTPSYMSPEQARGSRDIDARCDQYALGVILYACVTHRRPFEESTLYALLIAIGSGPFPTPRELRPELPKAFEEIILRAMSREVEARYPTVYAMGRAMLPFASAQIRANWSSSFSLERATQPPSAPPDAGLGSGVRSPSTMSRSVREVTAAARAPRSSRRPVAGLAAGLALLVAGGVAWFSLHGDRAPPAEHHAARTPVTPLVGSAPAASFLVETSVSPAHATLELDGAAVGEGPLRRELPRDGRPHSLRVSATGFEPSTVMFVDQPPPATIALVPLAPATGAEVAAASQPPSRERRSRASRHREPAAAGTAARVTTNGSPVLE